jgi:hypothetical protein
MATPAQISANQANAVRSTGPRTPEGKAASSRNALKHGVDSETAVIPGEDPAAYDALAAAYAEEHCPSGATEDFLVSAMFRADWQKRRAEILEVQLMRLLLEENPGKALGAAMLSGTPAARLLTRVQNQIVAHERAFLRAMRELRRLRDDAAGERTASILMRAMVSRPDAPETGHPPSPKLASFPQKAAPAPPPPAGARQPAPAWPPLDPQTGKPAFFVG